MEQKVQTPLPTGYGGARPGAGRPKGKVSNSTLLAREAKERAIQKIVAKWDKILFVMLAEGIGDYYIEEYEDDKEGKKKRIIRKGKSNPQVLKDLMEMVQGKPKQPLTHEGEIGNPNITDLASSIKEIAQSLKK